MQLEGARERERRRRGERERDVKGVGGKGGNIKSLHYYVGERSCDYYNTFIMFKTSFWQKLLNSVILAARVLFTHS